MHKCQSIRIFISVKPMQPLYFHIHIMLFQYRFEFIKISVTYDYILKTDARIKLKNEIYLTQMSMLMEVCSCY